MWWSTLLWSLFHAEQGRVARMINHLCATDSLNAAHTLCHVISRRIALSLCIYIFAEMGLTWFTYCTKSSEACRIIGSKCGPSSYIHGVQWSLQKVIGALIKAYSIAERASHDYFWCGRRVPRRPYHLKSTGILKESEIFKEKDMVYRAMAESSS